jgi:hypothetical protein
MSLPFQHLNSSEKALLITIGQGPLKLSKYKSDLGQVAVMRLFARLMNLTLIERYYESGETIFSCTSEGVRYLKEFDQIENGPKNIAAARNYDHIYQVYVPHKEGYIRNAGNKHIPSRGV